MMTALIFNVHYGVNWFIKLTVHAKGSGQLLYDMMTTAHNMLRKMNEKFKTDN